MNIFCLLSLDTADLLGSVRSLFRDDLQVSGFRNELFESNFVLTVDVQLLPGAKTRISNRRRKAARANMLTSSPYKNQLYRFLRLAENRGRGRRHKCPRGDGPG